MLVLTLRDGEKVKIGDDIIVQVHLNGNSISLGIDAPKDIPILRETLLKKAEEE